MLVFIVRANFAERKGCFVVAPTGIAAENVKGVTINSMFKIKFKEGEIPYYTEYEKCRGNSKLSDAFIIIVDEISMVSAERLDLMDRIARNAKKNDLPFGGIKMVFVGDFCQLLPIDQQTDSSSVPKCPNMIKNRGLAFESEVWHKMKPRLIQLKGSQRHKDDRQYLDILNKVRFGKWDENEVDKIRLCKYLNDTSRLALDQNAKLTRLFSDNKNVDILNSNEQNKLSGPENCYNGEYWWSILDHKPSKPQHYWPPERNNKELKLKIGSQVMLTRNIKLEEPYLVNGSRGEVISFKSSVEALAEVTAELDSLSPETPSSEEMDPSLVNARDVLRFQQVFFNNLISHEGRAEVLWPVVKFQNDVIKVIAPINDVALKSSVKNPINIFYAFVPLTLAWAMTIHKSQGLTIDSLEVDFKTAFAENQVYTALSRVRRLDQLRVFNLEPNHIMSNSTIGKFYEAHGNIEHMGVSWVWQKGGLEKWWSSMFTKGDDFQKCCSCKQQSEVCERYATEDSLKRLFAKLKSKLSPDKCRKYYEMLDEEDIDLYYIFGLIRENDRNRSNTISALIRLFQDGEKSRMTVGVATKIIDVGFELFPVEREEEVIKMPEKYRGGGDKDGKRPRMETSSYIQEAEESDQESDEENDGVYVLELEGKNFYVGKSSRKRQRILEHKRKIGATFTKKHSVVNDHSPRLSTPQSASLAAERLETLHHMVC